MCAKTRKSRTKKRGKKKGLSLFTMFFILVILSLLFTAIAYYFLCENGKTRSNSPQKTSSPTTKIVTGSKHTGAKSILDGTWVSTTDGRMLEIHGAFFSMELPSVSKHKIIKGKINISGNTAIIIYSGTKDQCAAKPGTYSFVITKKSIHFRVKHDNCPGRKQIFSTVWEKF